MPYLGLTARVRMIGAQLPPALIEALSPKEQAEKACFGDGVGWPDPTLPEHPCAAEGC